MAAPSRQAHVAGRLIRGGAPHPAARPGLVAGQRSRDGHPAALAERGGMSRARRPAHCSSKLVAPLARRVRYSGDLQLAMRRLFTSLAGGPSPAWLYKPIRGV